MRVINWLKRKSAMPPQQSQVVQGNPAVLQSGVPVQNVPAQQFAPPPPPQVPQYMPPPAPGMQQPQYAPQQPVPQYAPQPVQYAQPQQVAQPAQNPNVVYMEPQQPQQPQYAPQPDPVRNELEAGLQQYAAPQPQYAAPVQPPAQAAPVQYAQPVQQPAANLAVAAQPGTGVSRRVDMPEVPEWMRVDKAELGTEAMAQYISPPRLKIVQGQSGIELKRDFPESTVIVVASGTKPQQLTPAVDMRIPNVHSQKFRIVPIFFFAEFTLQNPGGLGMPFIRDRSTDPNSPLAMRCRGDFKQRKMQCPEHKDKECSFAEVLNFIVAIQDRPEFDQFYLMSFNKGEFTTGRNWCQSVRYPQGIPCYSQIFEVDVSIRTKEQNSWWGFNIEPAVRPDGKLEFLTDKSWFEYYRHQFLDLQDKAREQLIIVDYEAEAQVNGDNVINTTASKTTF